MCLLSVIALVGTYKWPCRTLHALKTDVTAPRHLSCLSSISLFKLQRGQSNFNFCLQHRCRLCVWFSCPFQLSSPPVPFQTARCSHPEGFALSRLCLSKHEDVCAARRAGRGEQLPPSSPSLLLGLLSNLRRPALRGDQLHCGTSVGTRGGMSAIVVFGIPC